MASKVGVAAVLALAGLVAGCGEDPAVEKAEDARDVAMVERMSREPLVPIVPMPITAQDVDQYGLDQGVGRPGCRFGKGEGAGPDPLFIASSDEGFLRIDGELRRYAAKGTSASLPGGARTTYVGLGGWIDLARLPDAGTGADALRWPARLVLHDSQERVVFTADGTMTCRE